MQTTSPRFPLTCKKVKDDNIQDPPLPPPTRLNTVPFAYLHEQRRNTEFDIIAIVVNCGSIKYAGANNSKCREITVMDTNMRPTILTLWEDFADADEASSLQRLLNIQ
ncbi:uncharacterized protein LOC142181639 [Nicotiana tabacum]|uniref:Uncharacterized protein LOC142181639 n=1 Tax=Nicotiana tabacum TaxID=4097 RepID=A0AC58UNE9_TOBAC